ncbi:hypothetical protein NLJ89_g4 [Agrocybe chaxingu]|uniref:Uncharacterized protein n=1 Tax=Agrocybe chaxingu TaxID=84603 RepID=A0A9W8TGW5_9AGAR|nr:hypothetical protein NLJ89_g4 [Agrocybe chaxingu]
MAKGLVKLLQSGDTPSKLEDLKVDVFHRNHDRLPGPVLDALIALLPRLKVLRRFVWDDKHGGTLLLHGIPWSQLKTAIRDVPSSLEDIFSYLSQRLDYLLHRFPAFTLANLTVLKLSRGCDPMWLLRHFTMPSLQHLEVGILRHDQQVLKDFLKRSPSIHTLVIDERHGEDDAYIDEILISDHEILAYLTNPCLRAIPRVGIDLLYTKERILALIQQRLDVHRPLPPLLCWRPSLHQRLVGWWDKLGPKYDALLFSYKEGAVELSPEYEFDDSDCLP